MGESKRWNVGVCSKHFKHDDIKQGEQRITLVRKNRPIPVIYDPENNIPKSLLPTPVILRKPPKDRNVLPDEKPAFVQSDKLSSLADLNETLCPPEYKFMRKGDALVMYYKVELVESSGAPKIVASISVDKNMHVKLFKNSAPVPLPAWFRHGTNCTLKSKGSLENFPSYIKNYDFPFPDDVLEELDLFTLLVTFAVSCNVKNALSFWYVILYICTLFYIFVES